MQGLSLAWELWIWWCVFFFSAGRYEQSKGRVDEFMKEKAVELIMLAISTCHFPKMTGK